MNFKSTLKPIQYLDEQVLRHYTKLGQKVHIDQGKRKYWTGLFLNEVYFSMTGTINRHIGGANLDNALFLGLAFNDNLYNWRGIFGIIKEDDKTSETATKDYLAESHRKYNSLIRLPIFLSGIGLVGKFAVDAVNSITNKTSIDPSSYLFLEYGIGQLSLASSMYLKETDPKLLDKVPYWKKAYEWLKEKAKELQPVPQPVPGYARTIEDLI